MRKFGWWTLCLFFSNYLFAQKPVLDEAAILTWPSLSRPGISADGSYYFFTVDNDPVGQNTLFLESYSGSWKKKIIPAPSSSFFSENGKKFIYKKSDSVIILDLSTKQEEVFTGITSMTSPQKKNTLVALMDKDKAVILCNMETGKRKKILSVAQVIMSDYGESIILKSVRDGKGVSFLTWINSTDFKESEIWKGTDSTGGFVFNDSSSGIAFLLSHKEGDRNVNEIWFYEKGMRTALRKIYNSLPGMQKGYYIKGGFSAVSFSKNGKWLFFKIDSLDLRKDDSLKADVDIWSYTDFSFQSVQLCTMKMKEPTVAIMALDGNEMIWKENYGLRLMVDLGQDLIIYRRNDFREYNYADIDQWWLKVIPQSYYLYSLSKKKETFLLESSYVKFIKSPDESHLVFFDQKQQNYFSFNITTGKIVNITEKCPYSLSYEARDKFDDRSLNEVGIYCWLDNENFLAYDNWDLWRININGKDPVNILNGFGRKNNIQFKILEDDWYRIPQLNKSGYAYLRAFDKQNKQTGYFKCSLRKPGDPEKLSMSDFNYNVYRMGEYLYDFVPLKAKKADKWIVSGMSSQSLGTFFLTADMKKFRSVINLQPEKLYNWYTTELVQWKNKELQNRQGVLYKPENFDSTKKYPLIIHYYEEVSDNLHVYIPPAYATGHINIPWLVSRGYLVFTPDIHYTIGQTGKSALNSVTSAIDFLRKYSWIDFDRMALQGFSHGGYQTDYIITHSNLFRAAVSAAGVVNLTSAYGAAWTINKGGSRMDYYEGGQGRMHSTLWERKYDYIDQSPIFEADKVTTPLLIMHNYEDGNVAWDQGLQFFSALRRMQKKVWMLQYNGQNHALDDIKAKRDYTLRMTQFFDYYLKDMPPPKWMTEGIPARFKLFDDRFAIDKSGKKP